MPDSDRSFRCWDVFSPFLFYVSLRGWLLYPLDWRGGLSEDLFLIITDDSVGRDSPSSFRSFDRSRVDGRDPVTLSVTFWPSSYAAALSEGSVVLRVRACIQYRLHVRREISFTTLKY